MMSLETSVHKKTNILTKKNLNQKKNINMARMSLLVMEDVLSSQR